MAGIRGRRCRRTCRRCTRYGSLSWGQAAKFSDLSPTLCVAGRKHLREHPDGSVAPPTTTASATAGIIKVMLMMKHRKVVPSLHFDKPNPYIDFRALNLSVCTKVAEWPQSTKNGPSPIFACVNSFGYGGTNVHAVLESFSAHRKLADSRPTNNGSSRPWLVLFSAASPPALLATLAHTNDAIRLKEVFDLKALAYTSAARRTHFRYRFSFLGNTMKELNDAITRRLAQPPGKLEPVPRNVRIVFVFCGMGTTFAGMGNELRQLEPIFDERLREVDDLVLKYTGWSVVEKMTSEQAMSSPEFSQPALFAVQVSLVRLLESWGVVPQDVIGHSVGEVAAAYAAKRLSLEDATKVSLGKM